MHKNTLNLGKMTAKHGLLLLFMISMCAFISISKSPLCISGGLSYLRMILKDWSRSSSWCFCLLPRIWPPLLEPPPGVKHCYHSSPTCPTNPLIGILQWKTSFSIGVFAVVRRCWFGQFSNYCINRTLIRQGSAFEKTRISWIVFLLGLAGSVWGVNKPKQRRAMQCLASVLGRIHLLHHTSHTHKLPSCPSCLRMLRVQYKLSSSSKRLWHNVDLP